MSLIYSNVCVRLYIKSLVLYVVQMKTAFAKGVLSATAKQMYRYGSA